MVKMGQAKKPRVGIRCRDLTCGAQNLLSFNEADAVELWNRRAPLPPTGEGASYTEHCCEKCGKLWLVDQKGKAPACPYCELASTDPALRAAEEALTVSVPMLQTNPIRAVSEITAALELIRAARKGGEGV